MSTISVPIETINEYRIVCDGPHNGPVYFTIPRMNLPYIKTKAREIGWHITTIRMYDEAGTTKEVAFCPKHARDRAVCEHEPKHKVWKAQDGDVAICKMTTSHLENAIPFVGRLMTQQERKIERLKDEKAQAEGVVRSIQGNITLAQMKMLAWSGVQVQMAHELDSRRQDYKEEERAYVALVGYAEDTTYQHPDEHRVTDEVGTPPCMWCVEGECWVDCQ